MKKTTNNIQRETYGKMLYTLQRPRPIHFSRSNHCMSMATFCVLFCICKGFCIYLNFYLHFVIIMNIIVILFSEQPSIVYITILSKECQLMRNIN